MSSAYFLAGVDEMRSELNRGSANVPDCVFCLHKTNSHTRVWLLNRTTLLNRESESCRRKRAVRSWKGDSWGLRRRSLLVLCFSQECKKPLEIRKSQGFWSLAFSVNYVVSEIPRLFQAQIPLGSLPTGELTDRLSKERCSSL